MYPPRMLVHSNSSRRDCRADPNDMLSLCLSNACLQSHVQIHSKGVATLTEKTFDCWCRSLEKTFRISSVFHPMLQPPPPFDSAPTITRMEVETSRFFPQLGPTMVHIRSLHLSIQDGPVCVDLSPLTSLEAIFLLNCKYVTQLPSSLYRLVSLTTIAADKTPISFISNDISSLTQLRRLVCSQGGLTAFPAFTQHNSQITHLNLSGNKITSVDKSISYLTNLVELDLNQNTMSYVDESISMLRSMTKFVEPDLIQGRLMFKLRLLPMELDKTYSQSLKSDDPFTINPALSTYMTQVRSLEIGQFSGSGAWLSNLQSLTRILLHKFTASCLPDSLSKLSTLHGIAVTEGQITQIPPGILSLPNLKYIQVPQSALSEGETCSIAYITNPNKILTIKKSWYEYFLKNTPIFHGATAVLFDCTLNFNITRESGSQSAQPVGPWQLECAHKLSSLSSLESINMSHCSLSQIPEEICQHTLLKTLILAHNKIEIVGESLCSLKNLCHLDISFNPVTQISEGVELPELKTLILSLNAWRTFPTRFMRNKYKLLTLTSSTKPIPELRFLEHALIQDESYTFPPNAANVLLEEFMLSRQPLQMTLRSQSYIEFPSALYHATSLKILDLSSNMISVLPSDMSNLISLESLDVSCNQLTSLPLRLFDISSLTNLTAASNQFNSPPALSSPCITLAQLDFSHNMVTSLSLFDMSFPGLTKLVLSHNRISMESQERLDFPTLRYLDVSSNNITSLGAGPISNFLVRLILSQNPISEIPGWLLQRGFIQEQSLQSAPDSTRTQPPVPQTLTPAYNRCNVYYKPDLEPATEKAHTKATKEHHVNMSDQGLQSIPDAGLFETITHLNVSNNILSSIHVIRGVSNLQVLDVSRNMLETLPNSLSELKNLKQLFAQHNPFKLYPEVLDRLWLDVVKIDFEMAPISRAFIPVSGESVKIDFNVDRGSLEAVIVRHSQFVGPLTRFPQLRELNLQGSNAVFLPKMFQRSTNLTQLTLSCANLPLSRDWDLLPQLQVKLNDSIISIAKVVPILSRITYMPHTQIVLDATDPLDDNIINTLKGNLQIRLSEPRSCCTFLGRLPELDMLSITSDSGGSAELKVPSVPIAAKDLNIIGVSISFGSSFSFPKASKVKISSSKTVLLPDSLF